jgi:PAS domain S-box-containing protein
MTALNIIFVLVLVLQTLILIVLLKKKKPFITNDRKNDFNKNDYSLRPIVENNIDGIILYNKNGVIFEWNKAIEKITGFNRDEVIGTNIFHILKQLLKINQAGEFIIDDLALDLINESPKKDPSMFEILIKDKKGETKNIELFIISGKSDDETIFGNIIRDITEKKKEIKETYFYLQYIIDSIKTTIITVDKDFNVTHENKAATRFRNENDPEISYLFTKYPKLGFIKESFDKCTDSNQIINDSRMVINETGETVYYAISVFPLSDEIRPGKVIMIDDITERIKMEEVMIQSEKMISVAGLAAGMAHEINNPLGTISQGCQNLIRRTSLSLPKNIEAANKIGILPENISKYFEIREIFEIINSIQQASQKASEIIKNMLQFSRRSESKKVLYNPEKLLNESLDLLYNDYSLKKNYDIRSIKIIKEIAHAVPDIKVTVTEIQQVIFNIIQNAVHALKDEENPSKNPVITLRLNYTISEITYEIEDNGPGILEIHKNRIFEPFFSTKEVGKGTGLGLSVAFMIIKNNHKGNISVESFPGKGTKFIIKLPVYGF